MQRDRKSSSQYIPPCTFAPLCSFGLRSFCKPEWAPVLRAAERNPSVALIGVLGFPVWSVGLAILFLMCGR